MKKIIIIVVGLGILSLIILLSMGHGKKQAVDSIDNDSNQVNEFIVDFIDSYNESSDQAYDLTSDAYRDIFTSDEFRKNVGALKGVNVMKGECFTGMIGHSYVTRCTTYNGEDKMVVLLADSNYYEDQILLDTISVSVVE